MSSSREKDERSTQQVSSLVVRATNDSPASSDYEPGEVRPYSNDNNNSIKVPRSRRRRALAVVMGSGQVLVDLKMSFSQMPLLNFQTVDLVKEDRSKRVWIKICFIHLMMAKMVVLMRC